MKFKYAILYVENVPETLQFYKDAFGYETKFLHDGKDYGELDTGDTTLAFSSLQLITDLGKNPSKPNPENPVFEIAFETDQVSKCLDKAVSCGAKLIQGIKEQPWGQTTASVCDKNGVIIEICTPVGR